MKELLLSGGQWSNHHHLFHSLCDEGFLCQYAKPFHHRHRAPSPLVGLCPSLLSYHHLHDAKILLRGT